MRFATYPAGTAPGPRSCVPCLGGLQVTSMHDSALGVSCSPSRRRWRCHRPTWEQRVTDFCSASACHADGSVGLAIDRVLTCSLSHFAVRPQWFTTQDMASLPAGRADSLILFSTSGLLHCTPTMCCEGRIRFCGAEACLVIPYVRGQCLVKEASRLLSRAPATS